ncbi:hypothetical protein W97_02105 [Coniosporium apollinis CBS 100218]|uniref:Uncharacterized protein n=1 Tax=Coniosporium apollinis (strain CBS 100218) TaxID=1168221 RepID=R7YLU0_CONA1|nr:uncharacterized protein W97_02105 [Coniosporium apollinis CBS 100218]EON62880.1 hypothetical protein W97_02105 [Coniosporium apollinis CBS 100218]
MDDLIANSLFMQQRPAAALQVGTCQGVHTTPESGKWKRRGSVALLASSPPSAVHAPQEQGRGGKNASDPPQTPHSMPRPSSSSGGLFGRKSTIFGRRQKADTDAQTTTTTTATATATTTASPPDQSETSTTSSHRRRTASSRHSISSSVTDIGASLRRSTSLRSSSNASSLKLTSPSTTTLATISYSPEKGATAANASKPTLSVSTFTRRQRSSDNVQKEASLFSKSPLSASDPKATVGMTAVPLRHAHQSGRLPGTAQSNISFTQSNGSLGPPAPVLPSANSPNPYAVFQHIHDTASKRIATLDYLRKVHEGHTYYLNTLHLPPSTLHTLPTYTPRKLAKRATHYLHLGFSLPTVLDLNSASATEYLRALNALLLEYETYQSIHGADGQASSLSRGKVAGMFKRATHAAASTKARRTSSAADAFHPQGSSGEAADASRPSTGSLGGPGAGPASTTASFASALPSGEDELLPGEEYSFLLTPSLPFEPDFFETFATLCDVLIDCYTRILQLLPTPEALAEEGRRAGGGGGGIAGGGGGAVGDLFAKADARIRKTIVAGIVREFEGASREGIRVEVASVGKVVLGGLV